MFLPVFPSVFVDWSTSQSVERAPTPSLAETEMYSSIFVFLFIMYMSMLQPVMSHEPYNSLLSLLSTHSTDWLVRTSYQRTRMSTNRYVATLKRLWSVYKGANHLGSMACHQNFYTAFWDLLGPLLLRMIHFSIQKGAFSRDVNISVITLLLKKDKKPTECGNYRPLTLLNADVKIYAKVISCCLQPHVSSLVDCDQTGFMKSHLDSDNVRRLLHVIDAATNIKTLFCGRFWGR